VKNSSALYLVRRWFLRLLTVSFVYVLISWTIRAVVAPPAAVGLQGQSHVAGSIEFLQDSSWITEQGSRYLQQEIFDTVFSQIQQSKELVLVDMFLFNAWQGPVAEQHRKLSAELTNTLIKQKRRYPSMTMIVISDPINIVYGGMQSIHFDAMTDAGIKVVTTRLEALQDSNSFWSGIWRWTIRPFGNGRADTLPNPFGKGRVSVRSYLSLLNFKANHRKLLVTDSADGSLQAVVSSANPHDGSSAHRNVALRFDGAAVIDLLRMEFALLEMSGAHDTARTLQRWLTKIPDTSAASELNIQVLGESRILDEIVTLLDKADAGTSIDLVMFYLSERSIVRAMKRAHERGASIRVLLDVNSDAFGRRKNGVPNRPVAAELTRAGIEVRWCATAGEQCHAKWLHVHQAGRHVYLLGSANYTRRNLRDFNLETNVRIEAVETADLVQEMSRFFENQWQNTVSEIYSVEYEKHADHSMWLMLQYRFMEATGLSTF